MWNAKWLTLVSCFLPLSTPTGRACSHGFDNNAFPLNDAQLLSLPTADYAAELRRIGMRPDSVAAAGEGHDAKSDLAELRTALGAGVPPKKVERILARYEHFRKEIRLFAFGRGRSDLPSAKLRVPPRIPADVPEEFNLYLRGAAAYHLKNFEGARYWWNRLLELPPEKRRYRTVWAAYMIGRTYAFSTDPAKAHLGIEWMAHTRALAAQGFADSQNLARASVGWQARGHLDAREYEHAFDLYFALADSASLAIAAQEALQEPDAVMDRLARHERSAKLITALIISQGGPWRPHVDKKDALRWLAALERAQIQDLDGADRVAWAAYQNGDVPAARRWLARANPESPMSQWLASKFLLRDGKVDEAAALLAKLVHTWPTNSEWNGHREHRFYPADSLAGELGVLHLHRGRYVDSMDLMLRAGLFRDAAYVAERVLTPDELKAYVDLHWPPSSVLPDDSPTANPEEIWERRGMPREQIPMRIRYLLARRLTRLGRHADAVPYLPREIRPLHHDYTTAIRGGDDRILSRDERGESLWNAAQLARNKGMELMATELDPDFFTRGGSGWREPRLREPTGPITTPSPDERRRATAHAPAPDKRFHYRHVAADHAWAAAQLLPDESDLKARVLHQAGQWLMAQDAPAADRFYKALVRQCGTTRLGRSARRLKWFP